MRSQYLRLSRYATGCALAALLSSLALADPALAEPAPAFAELLAQAQSRAPRIAEAEAALRQAEGLARQDAARPNPEASLEVENFAGRTPFIGFDEAETTLSVSQQLELGGKRPARIAAGRAAIEAARAQLDQARGDVAFDLALAYAEAEAARERLERAQEAVSLAQEEARVAAALVEAGREAELRNIQATSAVTAARADLDAARLEATTTLARLTALVGSPAPYTSLGGSLLNAPAAVRGSALDPQRSPAVRVAQAEREAAARRVRVEQVRAIPDVTVSAGVRRFAGEDASAFVAGVSAPIPLFDRNKGAVSAARAELAAVEARLAAAQLDAQADVRISTGQIEAAESRLAAAQEAAVAAEEAYRLTRLGYEGGKLPLSEVIAARRSLAEARTRTLEAQLARVRAEAGLARLQGRAPFGD